MIDNIKESSIYIEKYKQQTIKISSSSNQNGILEVDERGNILNNMQLTCGRQRVKSYASTSLGKILLYNDNQYTILESDFDLFYLFINPVNYKVRASSDTYTLGYSFSTNVYTFNTNITNTIFKVFINGKEITNYTIESGNLKVNKSDITYINHYDDNDIKIISYDNNQDLGNGLCYIYYDGFDVLYNTDFFDNLEDIQNIPYGSGLYGTGLYAPSLANIYKILETSDDISINTTQNFNLYKETLEYKNNFIEIDRDFSLELDLHSNVDKSDLIYWLNKSDFRIIVKNKYLDILRIYNNCRIIEIPTTTLSSVVKRKIKIQFENEIYVKNNEVVGSDFI